MIPMKIVTILFILGYAGCSTLTDEELWLKVEQAKNNNNWDSTRFVSERILKEYPEGRYAGWARFAIAESYRFQNHPREALDNYKVFIEKYPDLQPAAVSLFLVGFIYGNNLRMIDSARWYYEDFLKKYPKHDLVPSVKLELESLGKSVHEALDERLQQHQNITRY
ncbi:MAG: tetratricopeptide repeat protein [Bacteroidota bacterium]